MIGGKRFLVTCPIDMYARAQVALTPGAGGISGHADSPKARRAVALTLTHFRQPDVDAALRLSSPLPRGKGMASSSADVCAAIVATARALGREITPLDTARIALQVEPSDGIMLPRIAMFDHLEGSLARVLGDPPPMRILALDFGGRVDTLAFNGVNREAILERLEPRLQESLACIRAGIRDGDLHAIARGATISALANQEILYKPRLRAVMDLAPAVGAAGVNVAHSGTVIGMLFPDDDAGLDNAVAQVREKLPGLKQTFLCRVVSGGVILE